MNKCHGLMVAAVAAAASMYAVTSSAAALSGRYLVTLTGRPASLDGTTYCATLVADGSTENFPVSGKVTLQDEAGRSFAGTWFADHGVASFEVPLPAYSSSPSFIVFSGLFGKPRISSTSFTEVLNGAPAFDGRFTAVRGGCS